MLGQHTRANDDDRHGRRRLLDDPRARALKSPPPERVPEAERLTAAIAERIAEVLPPAEFRLKLEHPIISIDAIGLRCGNGYSTAPALFWYLPLPALQRLEQMFESQMMSLERFLSNVCGCPWPRPGALPHVEVTAHAVHAWWGGPREVEAVVRLRPVSRDELGV
jgi:hypothetical protein